MYQKYSNVWNEYNKYILCNQLRGDNYCGKKKKQKIGKQVIVIESEQLGIYAILRKITRADFIEKVTFEKKH